MLMWWHACLEGVEGGEVQALAEPGTFPQAPAVGPADVAAEPGADQAASLWKIFEIFNAVKFVSIFLS